MENQLKDSFEKWFDRQNFKTGESKELSNKSFFSGISEYKKLKMIKQLDEQKQKMNMLKTLSKIKG